MPDETPVSDTMPLFAAAVDPVDEQTPREPEATEAISLEPDDTAPYGYMIDRGTGERRAKKRPGRQRRVRSTGAPSPVDFTEKIDRAEDRAPGTANRKTKARKDAKPVEPVPPFRAGPIATGMNRLYARVGKLVRVWDADIGGALISITRKESDDDTTVGEAWEEIARTNPRIRAFLLKMLEGSAWSSLFMAHLPVFLAIAMKEQVRRHLPFGKFISAFLDTDEDGPSEVSEALGGIQSADVSQMMQMMAPMMGPMFDAMNLPRSATFNHTGPVVTGEDEPWGQTGDGEKL